MGVARLLAKGWVVFCLFAAAHEFMLSLGRGNGAFESFAGIAPCVLLFGAMGLLFIAGFGMSGPGLQPLLARFRPQHLLPGFNGTVFAVFVALSFAYQVFGAPVRFGGTIAIAIHNAMMFTVPGTDYYIVPGHAELMRTLDACRLDGSRYLAGAFTWLLAIIYLASAVSRVGITAGLIRLERSMRPSSFGPTTLAAIYGVTAVAVFQLFYIGSAYRWLDCVAYADVGGAVLIGLAPLMLAHLMFVAFAMLRASGPERHDN